MQIAKKQFSGVPLTRSFAATSAITPNNQKIIDKNLKYVAHNYKSLPVALVRGKGVFVWDADGRKYLDFLNGYSSSNQGHCHPKIVAALKEQASKLTQVSRAFHNEHLGEAGEYFCKLLGYDKMLPMNGGVEACETAVKIARRWGYMKKQIPDDQATVLVARGNFWGRTITASGACDDPSRYTNFGPFTPGFELINYNDLVDTERVLKEKGHLVCAVMVEPIQGEAGCIVPDKGYLVQLKALCKKYNCLLILDEI